MQKSAFVKQAVSRSKDIWVVLPVFERGGGGGGGTSVDDDERPGQPVPSSASEMIERVHDIIRENRHRTTNKVSALVGIRRLNDVTEL